MNVISKHYGHSLVAGMLLGLLVVSGQVQAKTPEQEIAEALKTGKPLDVISAFLSNTAPDKITDASQKLVASDATYVSLNFENPELKQIEPWTGTSKGPAGFISTFVRVQKYWDILDFKVSDMFSSGENVAVFGRFTYRSKAVGNTFTSPFAILAKVNDGKIEYFQFMEDTYATASSFRRSGKWLVKTDPTKDAYLVGK